MEAIKLIDKTLASLKDFQRETVKSVMASFQQGDSQRVLVADEVGLGKTIVAKGVIAELLKERLLNQPAGTKITPLRVTYICSNLTLAEENRKKLAVFHGDDQDKYVLQPSYGRLLDTAVKINSEGNIGKLLEVCSLTPSTSFSLTRGHGYWRERMIVFAALIENPDLHHHRTKLSNFFSDNFKNWSENKKYFINNETLVPKVANEFHTQIRKKIPDAVKEHCGISLPNPSWLDVLLAYCRNELQLTGVYAGRFRTCIRALMAKTCAANLTADLFILDEFQRFKALLDNNEENEESLIAREVFGKKRTKALLLSATPFKAVSLSEDDEEGNAHAEELNYLLDFLSLSNQEFLLEYEKNRKALQQQILKLKDVSFNLETIESSYKASIEKLLEPYLCRTERAQISDSYENLFCSSVPNDVERIKDFSKQDIEVFKVLDQLGLALQIDRPVRSAVQLMEFYKASPWPLSFLSGYQFKKDLDKYSQDSQIRQALKKSYSAWLSRNELQSYTINLENAPQAKMRALVKRLFKTNSEELLWIPPSLPHYPLQGSFEHQQDFSKTLLFSSWAMVPRALSSLISYEAERRLLANRKGVKKSYFKDVSHTPRIRFDAKSSLAPWSLVYPAKTLCDMPLETDSGTLNEIIKKRAMLFREKLSSLHANVDVDEQRVRSGDKWYALAPMLLDIQSGNQQYLNKWLAEQQSSIAKKSEHKGISVHFNMLLSLLKDQDNLVLGPMPEDLSEYIALLSIAGPAVAVCRMLNSQWPDDLENAASSATDVAFAMVALFNKPEAEGILNKRFSQLKYFQAIVQYCANGGLQAVMDEYGHMLKDAGFPMATSNKSNSDSATTRLAEVLSIKTVSVVCQFAEHKNKSSEDTLIKADKENNRHSMRCHYSVPFGNQKMTDESSLQRVGSIRDTFNSPFRPFVLNSTSIGQEGLDFHWYCNQIVHWNLPSNPIDIEQREGRINRYKSLVVRKRLAEVYGSNHCFKTGDKWKQLFDIADEETRSKRSSDLVPYWHLPEGTAKIERFVPMMPLSRDVFKLDHALRVLALYRLAFGQPRQEELLDNLLKRRFSNDEIKLISDKLVINLSPMNRKKA